MRITISFQLLKILSRRSKFHSETLDTSLKCFKYSEKISFKLCILRKILGTTICYCGVQLEIKKYLCKLLKFRILIHFIKCSKELKCEITSLFISDSITFKTCAWTFLKTSSLGNLPGITSIAKNILLMMEKLEIRNHRQPWITVILIEMN